MTSGWIVTFLTLPKLWLRLVPRVSEWRLDEDFLNVECCCTLLAAVFRTNVSVLHPSSWFLEAFICFLFIFSVEHFGIVIKSVGWTFLPLEDLSRSSVLHFRCFILTESKLKSREQYLKIFKADGFTGLESLEFAICGFFESNLLCLQRNLHPALIHHAIINYLSIINNDTHQFDK